MILRPLAATALAAGLLFAAPAAHAQYVVHDPRALVQMIEDARTSLEQLQALQAQIEEQRALFDSLNDLSDVNRLAESLGAPELRNPLPDGRALRAAAEGDLSALGALADRADAIRRETRLYTPSGGELSEADAYYRDSLERAGARTARDLAIGEAVGAASDRRLDGLETLRRALDTAPNARAVMDLEARLSAEQALIQNEQLRLQGLAVTQAAEARLEEQRNRERAEAARAARQSAYERTFR
ncbi:MAG TPA: type IV secretion system protein [Brevundimonas sp.]|uniref:type IV secretion system protein n=1 Tax=uncultured Brevundimonas sp. TaxID=213418 RepID=UPI000C901364|nr:type IV secretion system protein [Brevundimonas sp.]HAF81631.1 type IV secretion system protein [Brevundimonas sp.]